jgi:hypothetical protein
VGLRSVQLTLDLSVAAKRADRCLSNFTTVHQKLDCLRQDLIQEMMSVYRLGVFDAQQERDKVKGKVPNTARQAEILNYVKDFVDRRGHKPTYAMIARHLGIKSKTTVAKHVATLRRQGFQLETIR